MLQPQEAPGLSTFLSASLGGRIGSGYRSVAKGGRAPPFISPCTTQARQPARPHELPKHKRVRTYPIMIDTPPKLQTHTHKLLCRDTNTAVYHILLRYFLLVLSLGKRYKKSNQTVPVDMQTHQSETRAWSITARIQDAHRTGNPCNKLADLHAC